MNNPLTRDNYKLTRLLDPEILEWLGDSLENIIDHKSGYGKIVIEIRNKKVYLISSESTFIVKSDNLKKE